MANWITGGANYEADQAERVRWFNKIAPKENWKTGIDCWIEAKDYEECNSAAIWFTGGPLMIVEGWLSKVRVKGDGYYLNCGA